jgi:hypothetical protein
VSIDRFVCLLNGGLFCMHFTVVLSFDRVCQCGAIQELSIKHNRTHTGCAVSLMYQAPRPGLEPGT